jgi:hypothetical protein
VDRDLGAEVLGVAVGVGDVVAVGEEDDVDPAELGHRVDDLTGPAGCVDHEVRVVADDQVRVRTERGAGVVASGRRSSTCPTDRVGQTCTARHAISSSSSGVSG